MVGLKEELSAAQTGAAGGVEAPLDHARLEALKKELRQEVGWRGRENTGC
jgi:hypothetical protein